MLLGWWKFYSQKKKNQTEKAISHQEIYCHRWKNPTKHKPIINPHDDDYFIVEKNFLEVFFHNTHSKQKPLLTKHWEDVDDEEASFELPDDENNDDQIKNKKAVAG